MSKGGGGSYREWNLDCKVYIGNLSEGSSKIDVENAFGKYGPLRNVWVARNPPGFAFVEYDDPRDAEDAVRAIDGTRIGGSRVRVEMSHGRTRRSGGGGSYPSPRRGGDHRGGDRSRGDRRGRDRDRSPDRFRGSPRGGRGRSRSKSRSHTC